MPQETYTPAQAAKQAAIPLSTLRLWTGIYAEFLSDTATPGVGVNRRLTPQDIEVLKAVAQLRHNGLEPAQITARLRDNLPEALQTPATPTGTPTTALEVHPSTNTQPAPPNTPEAFLAVATSRLDDVARQVASVDERLARVESGRNLVLVAVAAFVAGVVLVTGIVWIVSLIR